MSLKVRGVNPVLIESSQCGYRPLYFMYILGRVRKVAESSY